MKRSPVRHPSRRESGLSLIELMVAVLLGLIVVGGLIQVLITNRQALQIQQGNNYLQQNLRFASDRIGWSVRMADFWGGVSAANVSGLGNGSGATACSSSAWELAGKSSAAGGGVFGYDGKATFPVSSCVANSDYVPGSDVLVVRYVDTDPCKVPDGATALDISTCGLASKYYVAANVGQTAQLFDAASAVPSLAGNTRRYVYPYRVEMYYLQPCSVLGAGCSAASDGGQPIPTLVRMRLASDGTMVREPVVDGIEALQFEYGLSGAAGSGVGVVRYKNATSMAATDWPNVIAVRISMVARSRERDMALSHAGTFALTSTCSYAIGSGGTMTLTNSNNDCTGFSLGTITRADTFTRNLLQQVVQVRNRVRNPG